MKQQEISVKTLNADALIRIEKLRQVLLIQDKGVQPKAPIPDDWGLLRFILSSFKLGGLSAIRLNVGGSLIFETLPISVKRFSEFYMSKQKILAP